MQRVFSVMIHFSGGIQRVFSVIAHFSGEVPALIRVQALEGLEVEVCRREP